MPSPFPGMDPYLERPGIWPDMHLALIIEMRFQLNAVLPERYTAVADAHVWIHEQDAESRSYRPDVFIIDEAKNPRRGQSVATLNAPASALFPPVCKEGAKYLKVVDIENNRVVTVIELLSPTNKRIGPDRDAYLMKRAEYIDSLINLVEIDLLRGGLRPPLDEPTQELAEYYVAVCRVEQMPQIDLWPFGLRDPIPEIQIPLPTRKGEPKLNLRQCLDRAYDGGKCHRRARYQDELTPPIRDEDREWVNTILAQATAASP